MLKVLINKLKALFNQTPTEVPVDDVYITLFQTNKSYPNEELLDSNNSYMFHYFHECGA